MLAKKNYELNDRYLRIPGVINQTAFGLGFIFLCIAIAIKIWG